MRWTAPLCLTLALAGCSRCDAPPATSGDAAKPASAADAAPKPAPDAAPAAPADPTGLLPPAPGLPAPLEGLSFDLDHAAAVAKFPAAVRPEGAPVPGHPGVVARVAFLGQNGPVRYGAVELPEALLAWVREKWSGGIEIDRPDGKDTYWLDPSHARQFVLAGNTLTVWPMKPWEALLGEGKPLGFEVPERPLLGATLAEINEKYAFARPRALSDKQVELRFPPQPLQTSPARVKLTLVDGKVERVRLKLYHADRGPVREAMLGRLAQKYGTPQPNDLGQRIYRVDLGAKGEFKAEVKVLELDVGRFLRVEIGPRAP